jgi:hypothetical protein
MGRFSDDSIMPTECNRHHHRNAQLQRRDYLCNRCANGTKCRAAMYKIASPVRQLHWRNRNARRKAAKHSQECDDGPAGPHRASSTAFLSPIADTETEIPQARSTIRVPILWSAVDLSSNHAEKFFRVALCAVFNDKMRVLLAGRASFRRNISLDERLDKQPRRKTRRQAI